MATVQWPSCQCGRHWTAGLVWGVLPRLRCARRSRGCRASPTRPRLVVQRCSRSIWDQRDRSRIYAYVKQKYLPAHFRHPARACEHTASLLVSWICATMSCGRCEDDDDPSGSPDDLSLCLKAHLTKRVVTSLKRRYWAHTGEAIRVDGNPKFVSADEVAFPLRAGAALA